MLVLGLSSGNKLGLGLIAGAFILFAVIVSMVLPRYREDFPGKTGMRLFIVATLVFFLATLAAVEVFAKEKEEKRGGEAVATQPAEGTTTAPAPKGDAAAGKAVFASAGCGGCHTLKAAGATGNVGPNLDEAKPRFEKVVTQVTHGGGAMPAFKGELTPKQIDDVAAYVVSSTQA